LACGQRIRFADALSTELDRLEQLELGEVRVHYRNRLAGLPRLGSRVPAIVGDKAVAEAAQRACTFEKEGKSEEAETWRHIEAALKAMRGPHES
jgi:hypothetical protein